MPTNSIQLAFLFTDIEGSTRLWEAQPDEMQVALACHDERLRAVIASHDGQVKKPLETPSVLFSRPPWQPFRQPWKRSAN